MHPLVVKHVLLPAHEMLLGRGTLAYLRDLEESQWWSAQRLRDLQESKLRRLLTHAAENTAFYRRRLADAGIDPHRITLNQLSSIPTVDKDQIRLQLEDMVAPEVSGGLRDYTTGGSTGDPLVFKIDRFRQAADQAARARTRRWFGIDVGERELYLWGAPVELDSQDRLKRIRDRLTNHRLLSAFNMTRGTMSRYLDELQRFDPVHLFGYPSSIAQLVKHADSIGRRVSNASLRAVFVTGEVFAPPDRAIIEEATCVPVADGYGSREAGFIAHQCPEGNYHVTMESLIVEIVDEEGLPAARQAEGEIVVTHLDTIGLPFVRYRTGDVGRKRTDPCPCGRGLECLEIVAGRRTDMLRTVEGGYAHALSVIYVLRNEPAIARFRVVQKANLDLDVDVVAQDELGEDKLRELREQLRRTIGGSIRVDINLVSRIPVEPSGKYRYVVSQAN